jgi:hypothetical protein
MILDVHIPTLAMKHSATALHCFLEIGVELKDAVFWDVAPCGSYKNPQLVIQPLTISFALEVFSTLKMEMTRSSETSVLSSKRCGNFKPYFV